MTPVAYVANSFPEASETYVSDEILELRRRGCRVLPYSFRRPTGFADVSASQGQGTVYVLPLGLRTCLLASWLCIWKFGAISDLARRAMQGPERWQRRIRTLFHTWLGAYLAVLLRRKRIEHIHVHHGFFASWCGMVASRLLGVGFSMTLHGSDLLVRADYLDCKLKNCQFCFTVSEFNRNFILQHYEIADDKVKVHRVGIDLDCWRPIRRRPSATLTLVCAGRLHSVKNHAFLVLACHSLKNSGVSLRFYIAGEGEEREKLVRLINELGLQEEVHLLGHVPQTQLPQFYSAADVVILTSRSEGIPVTLMEAMAMEQVVLAPAITGIPELVTSGKTGFLYQPGSMDNFLAQLIAIKAAGQDLDHLRRAARRQIERNYNSRRNLSLFADDFLQLIRHGTQPRASQRETDEDTLLQQVQLRV